MKKITRKARKGFIRVTLDTHGRLRRVADATGRTLGAVVDDLLKVVAEQNPRAVKLGERRCHDQRLVKVTPELARRLKLLRQAVSAKRESDLFDAVVGDRVGVMLAEVQADERARQAAVEPAAT